MLLLSKFIRTGLVTKALNSDATRSVELAHEIRAQRHLGALAIREVDAGSCNGCEIETSGLTSPVHDSERYGIRFMSSPSHADIPLVTKPVMRNMEVPLCKTYEATPAQ